MLRVLDSHCIAARSQLLQSFLARFGRSEDTSDTLERLLQAARSLMSDTETTDTDVMELLSNMEVAVSDSESGEKLYNFLDASFSPMPEKEEAELSFRQDLLGLADEVEVEEVLQRLEANAEEIEARRLAVEKHRERILELLRDGPGSNSHEKESWDRLVSLMGLYLDRLLQMLGQEDQDVWHVQREMVMRQLAEEVEGRTKMRGTGAEEGLDPEPMWIQRRIAEKVNLYALRQAGQLPDAFLQHQWARGLDAVDTSFSVKKPEGKTLPVTSLFDVFEHPCLSKEQICTEPISARFGDEMQCYQFMDFELLRNSPEKFNVRFNKYINGLRGLCRRQRLWQFQQDIARFNASKSLENFEKVMASFACVLVIKGKVARKCLESGLEPPENLKGAGDFVDSLATCLEHMLLVEDRAQSIASELRQAADIYEDPSSELLESFEGNRDSATEEVAMKLATLRSTLGFKAYRASAARLVEQERDAFLARWPEQDCLADRVTKLKHQLSQVLWLRRTLLSRIQSSTARPAHKEFFATWKPKLCRAFGPTEAVSSAERLAAIDGVLHALQEQKDALLALGLQADSVQELAKKLDRGELEWGQILQPQNLRFKERIQQVALIFSDMSTRRQFKPGSLQSLIRSLDEAPVDWHDLGMELLEATHLVTDSFCLLPVISQNPLAASSSGRALSSRTLPPNARYVEFE